MFCLIIRAAFLLLLLVGCCGSNVFAEEVEDDDTHERCPTWADEGECWKESEYMDKHCPKSCRIPDIDDTEECEDIHPRCSEYAGECKTNEMMRRSYCRKTCNACDEDYYDDQEDFFDNFKRGETEIDENACKDEYKECQYWQSIGECEKNSVFMLSKCMKACNACPPPIESNDEMMMEQTSKFGEQQVVEGSKSTQTMDIIRKSVYYMQSKELQDLPDKVVNECKNRNKLCSFWAAIGECEVNEAYMVTNCAPSCRSCDKIDISTRCPPLVNPKPGLTPGSLNKMFERIVETAPGNRTLTEEERKALQDKLMPEYTVTVHSRPALSDEDKEKLSKEIDKSSPPWIITFDNFITDEECQHMIDLGYKEGYKRSQDVGAEKFDGSHDSIVSTRRTSENAWCSEKGGCRLDEVTKRLHERMGEIMDIDPNNSEDFQILKYEIGQFYRQHHDYIGHQRDRQCGPRILTFFLYLSDVESGGGTYFPKLDIKVEAKKGRALLWPSVLNSDPMNKDDRTDHEALNVEEGTKFAANGWIHMYDYLAASKKGCS